MESPCLCEICYYSSSLKHVATCKNEAHSRPCVYAKFPHYASGLKHVASENEARSLR